MDKRRVVARMAEKQLYWTRVLSGTVGMFYFVKAAGKHEESVRRKRRFSY